MNFRNLKQNFWSYENHKYEKQTIEAKNYDHERTNLHHKEWGYVQKEKTRKITGVDKFRKKR